MQDENKYIEKVLNGDTRAFKMLVEHYQHMVFTICVQILKSRDLAEEAAQNAFIKAYRHLDRFEKRSKFKTWLYRIAYRSAIDYARKNKIRQSAFTGIEEVASDRVRTDEPNAQDLLEGHDKHKIISEALDELQPEDALIIKLYYLEERNIREIAKIMKMTESNVKIKLFRNRSKLRAILIRVKKDI